MWGQTPLPARRLALRMPIIGGAVNLAARLSDHAQDGEILISRRTFVEVEQLVAARPAGSVSLKGMTQPVDVFLLEGLKDDSILVPLATYSKQS